MSTYDTTLLTVLTILMSIFFLLGIIAAAMFIKVMTSVRVVVQRAEAVVDSVETAAEVLKDASGKMAVFKLIKNIIDLVQRKK
jgi:hypothetical protein